MAIPRVFSLARMTTATAGAGTITLGSAATVNGVTYLTFANAGVSDGDIVPYGIADSGASEYGYGTYTASGTTLTRNPIRSTNSNNAISLSGAAQVFITPGSAELLWGFDTPRNMGIAASVGSNALTITLQDAYGATPAALNPVLTAFRSPTATTGTPVLQPVRAATTLVVSSGSTLGVVSGASFKLNVVLFDDAGTERLGVINATTLPVDETYVASSTAEGGAGAADSFNTYYTGSAVSSKAFRNIGTLEWANGLPTAGAWSAGPTTIQPAGGTPSRPPLYAAPFDAMAYVGLAINGGMEVSQENGTTSTAVASATDKYIVDQWLLGFTSTLPAVVVGQQISATPTPPAGFSAALQMKATTADASLASGEYFYFRSPIEGYRTSRLAFGTAGAYPVTIGFWVYATIAGTMTAAVGNSAANRSYVSNIVINNAATWEWKTVTIPGDTTGTWLTTNGIGLNLILCFGSGSTFQGTNNTWNAANNFATSTTTNFFATNNNVACITGVQILPGSEAAIAARSQNRRHFADELRLCHRYYWLATSSYPVLYDYIQAGATFIGMSVPFPVEMCGEPTVAVNGTWSVANVNQPTVVQSTVNGTLLRAATTAAGLGIAYPSGGTLTANARL